MKTQPHHPAPDNDRIWNWIAVLVVLAAWGLIDLIVHVVKYIG